MLNVKKYGAAGDGATDDTVAIQDTVDAVLGDGGGVYLPPGTYKITAPIELREGITVLGDSMWGTQIHNANDDDAFVTPITGNYLKISDLCIEDTCGARTKGAAIHIDTGGGHYNIARVQTVGHYNGIRADGTMCSSIRDSRFSSALNDGFYTEGTCNALTLSNVYAVASGNHGFNILSPVYSSLNTCACDSSVGDAYHFRTTADNAEGATDLTLTSCGAEANTGYALYIKNGVHVVATACYFSNVAANLIYLHGTVNSSLIGVVARPNAPQYGLITATSTFNPCSDIAGIVSNIDPIDDAVGAYTAYP